MSTLLAVATMGCGRISYDTRETAVYSSCAEVRDTHPEGGDGVYLIAADAVSAPVDAYCDLTTDGGGWMLVTPDMIDNERSLSVTVVSSGDERGGLIMRVYANAWGCAEPMDIAHGVTFADRPAWTEIRAHYTFAGGASCWTIFGEVSLDAGSFVDGQPILPNLIPFEPAVDTIRDEVKMGGVAGDAFDGMNGRCDNETTNFWHGNQGPDERSATVILRRDVTQPGLAGLGTTTSCTEFGPGTSSPTWWQFSDISVR